MPGLSLVQDTAEHWRELGHDRDFFGGDVAGGLCGIEFRGYDAGAAGLLQGQHQPEARYMKQRQRAQIDIALVKPPRLDQ